MKFFSTYWFVVVLGANTLVTVQCFSASECGQGLETEWNPFPNKVIGFDQSKSNNASIKVNQIYYTDKLETCLQECCSSKYGECNILGYSRKGFKFNCYHWFCFPLTLCVFMEAQGTDSYILTEINKIANETHFNNAKNFGTIDTKISASKMKTMTTTFQAGYKERTQEESIQYEPQDLVTKPTLKLKLNHGFTDNKEFQDNFVTNAVSYASVAVGNEDTTRTKSNFGLHKLDGAPSGTGNERNSLSQKHLNEMKDTENDDSAANSKTSYGSKDTFNISNENILTGKTSKKFEASVVFSTGRNKEKSIEVNDNKEVVTSPSFDIFYSKSSPPSSLDKAELQDTFNNSHFIKANNSHNHNTFKLVNSRNISASVFPFDIVNKALNINISLTTFDATIGNTSDRDTYIIVTSHNNANRTLEINYAFTYENNLSLNTSSIHLVIVLIIGLIIVLIAVGLVASRVYGMWQRRHYCKMDFLIEGMYH
ncbi:uncharacterized protein LOC106475707 isoform X2 [Limulus polyphemus]|nr:uncharacterized protein LOC106475707 isoform X2 [Limulus polyphemus]